MMVDLKARIVEETKEKLRDRKRQLRYNEKMAERSPSVAERARFRALAHADRRQIESFELILSRAKGVR
jgi:hypothetical protein